MLLGESRDAYGFQVNLAKSNIQAFNMSEKEASNTTITYKEEEVKMVTSYTYTEVVSSGPSFNVIPTTKSRWSRGYEGSKTP